MEKYQYKGNKRLRYGYTTGSCAAAAAKAAVEMALSQKVVRQVSLMTPKGFFLELEVHEPKIASQAASCKIQKDAGDDPDVTHGILIEASAALKPDQKEIIIEGGSGVGRVTRPGLDQPPGSAAINRVPRRMITEAVQEVCDRSGYKGGVLVEISVPQGEEIAKKTFNPRLGIEGGISILGTSGIVEPMSEKALLDTIETEIRVWSVQGAKTLILVPGNYGSEFLKSKLGLSPTHNVVKCSNFVGETIDMAFPYGLKGMLLVGHIGKLVKLGAGIMNTHSRWADGRMEVLAGCAIRANAPKKLLKDILDCVTTEEALNCLQEAGLLNAVMRELMKRIEHYLKLRASCRIGAIVFSNQYGTLGKTSEADSLLKEWEEECTALYGSDTETDGL